ncbi:hypothetical protein IC620_13830 [Hazenella sp. IB182357]|uniref:Uncharacterized protein n=1 Tax=Polycladospora coralii TaxID=2771432 RepID=A0A926NDJ8_9BACL|nr:hypothetical protein [Polycladospora coralii]MBD1373430.1 hypothetical protein [Polycladospora coralii]MBS7531208.1 hypothetical protein [Polycladospora coralii]
MVKKKFIALVTSLGVAGLVFGGTSMTFADSSNSMNSSQVEAQDQNLMKRGEKQDKALKKLASYLNKSEAETKALMEENEIGIKKLSTAAAMSTISGTSLTDVIADMKVTQDKEAFKEKYGIEKDALKAELDKIHPNKKGKGAHKEVALKNLTSYLNKSETETKALMEENKIGIKKLSTAAAIGTISGNSLTDVITEMNTTQDKEAVMEKYGIEKEALKAELHKIHPNKKGKGPKGDKVEKKSS